MAEQSKNGVLQTLATSGNATVQLGTLLVVVLSGVGSFFQTNNLSKQSLEDRDRAVRQIHLLYERVDGFETRQIQVLNGEATIIKNQEEILKLLQEGRK